MSQKTDKRHCQAKHRPAITPCRGGIKMILTGRNTHGKPAAVTVFIDNLFLPGIVGDITKVVKGKAAGAGELVRLVKEAANG